MPHINRIRVNNVKYNFGTQFYDDFVMRFDGRNVLYDLANGGGKSVLLLLLLQNLIPNCTLDDKQPVEKLFRGPDGSTVIHSLIEWKLDDDLVRDDYRYMLTGFCARKAKEEDDANAAGEVAAIEYFNYAIFYQQYNDNDIVNLPLNDGKQRITYPGLKTYLKNLGRKDYRLQVHLFERKGEYQRFISRYGLYESEWEIIRGINKTEGHVRTYFESHYRTTRKVVEDLLIEEIIRKAFDMRTALAQDDETMGSRQDTAQMADTLYRIKDQLSELAKKKAQMQNYDLQREVLQSLGERIQTLDQMYQDAASLRVDIVKTWQSVMLQTKIKSRDLAVAEKEKAYAAKKKDELSRKLATVRIQSSRQALTTLETAVQECLKAIQEGAGQQALMRDQLNLRESMNDYLDYLEDQTKYKAIVESIRHATDDEQELLRELRQYAAAWKKRYHHRCGELNLHLVKDKAQIQTLDEQKHVLEQEEREADRIAAVLAHEVESGQAAEKTAMAQFEQLRQQSGLLIIEAIEKTIRQEKKQLEMTQKELESLQQSQADAKDAQIHQAHRLQSLDTEIERKDQEMLGLKDFLKAWQQNLERLEKLMVIYHVQDIHDLKTQIFERYRRLICEMAERQQQIYTLSERIQELQAKNPLTVTEDVQQLMTYIRSCHGIKCMYGADYLKTLPMQERQALLERLPMLANAVILNEGFAKVAADVLLHEKNFGDHVIPVLGLETVLSDSHPVLADSILFAGKGRNFFLDEKLLANELEHCEETMRRQRQQLARMLDQQTTYEKDLEEVSGFWLIYDSRKEDHETQLAACEAEKRVLLKEKETILSGQEELQQRMDALIVQLAEKQAAIEQQHQQCAVLEELQSISETLQKIRDKKADDEARYVKARRAKYEKNQALEVLVQQLQTISERVQTVTGQKEALTKEWRENWQMYLPESLPESDERLDQMPDEDLRAAFMGAKAVYEQGHMDLADKQQLMESYNRSMERLLKSITDRSQQPERLDSMYRKGELYRTLPEQIETMRLQLKTMEDAGDALKERLASLEAEKNRLGGSVDQAVTVVEERYGVYQEVNLHDQTYENYIQNATGLLHEVSEKQQKADRQIERLTKESYFLEGLRRDLERLMASCHAEKDLTQATYGSEVSLKRKYEELLARNEALQKQHFARKDAFEKDKTKAMLRLHELEAEELAVEIREHLTLPENGIEAENMLTAIRETMQIIQLEKERIEKNATELRTIKENFANQCIQVCRNIRMELEKLPKMSTITMDGEQIKMIGLAIPYIKENFYEQQMSAYIDEIVTTTDTMASQEEKMRYIRQQLAWKRLFAVIVSDMNAIRLTLYKRERIREQSRYLRYEEAVGSTGQSQGIYIQFLIAIIHYISCIHAGKTAGETLKKVIFIDNPFGAAKDIYIWEPIFALLKTNDVQLIVPARGATPAITGKFDVNYVLGQKMLHDRQQTIVVDYHSNIVIEEMEYVKIDYEQEVFDFV